MDAIENPIKKRIQDLMNQIDVEQVIKNNVPEFQKNGINMKFDFQF